MNKVVLILITLALVGCAQMTTQYGYTRGIDPTNIHKPVER